MKAGLVSDTGSVASSELTVSVRSCRGSSVKVKRSRACRCVVDFFVAEALQQASYSFDAGGILKVSLVAREPSRVCSGAGCVTQVLYLARFGIPLVSGAEACRYLWLKI